MVVRTKECAFGGRVLKVSCCEDRGFLSLTRSCDIADEIIPFYSIHRNTNALVADGNSNTNVFDN